MHILRSGVKNTKKMRFVVTDAVLLMYAAFGFVGMHAGIHTVLSFMICLSSTGLATPGENGALDTPGEPLGVLNFHFCLGVLSSEQVCRGFLGCDPHAISRLMSLRVLWVCSAKT